MSMIYAALVAHAIISLPVHIVLTLHLYRTDDIHVVYIELVESYQVFVGHAWEFKLKDLVCNN